MKSSRKKTFFAVVAFHVTSWGCTSAERTSTGSGGKNGSDGVFELPSDETPWTEEVQGYSCTHVKVEKDCADGWCRIPAGCFRMGSPEDEPYRGLYTEDLMPVVLTHAFVIQETELTQAQWLELVDRNPSGRTVFPKEESVASCLDLDCPVGKVNWWEAVEFANRLSTRDGLEPCYRLASCTGVMGGGGETDDSNAEGGFECELEGFAEESIYDCEGYRLPTEAEAEYATRAGTRTAYYSGGLALEDVRECERELPQLGAIAWYCANGENATHPVAKKLANRWGLFDLLGNASEWGNNRDIMLDPGPAPWVDPFATNSKAYSAGEHRHADGGASFSEPSMLRAAESLSLNSAARSALLGFRLVRSLPESP